MRGGGSIAFYEIAATIIPAILLGGLALELFGAEASGSGGEVSASGEGGKSETKNAFETRSDRGARGTAGAVIAVVAYPTLGVLVVLAEWVALEAVVTGEGNTGSAILVTSALAFGFMAGASRFFLLPGYHRSLGSGRAHMLAFVLSCLVSGALIVTFLKADIGTRVLWKEVARDREPELSDGEADRLWLKHLIATADFRIDRLRAEAEWQRENAKERVMDHLRNQTQVQRQVCQALKDLTGAGGAEEEPRACAE